MRLGSSLLPNPCTVVGGFSFDPLDGVDAESLRNAKGWIGARMAGGAYGETADQAALSAQMDLDQVFLRNRSFRKLCDEWTQQVGAP